MSSKSGSRSASPTPQTGMPHIPLLSSFTSTTEDGEERERYDIRTSEIMNLNIAIANMNIKLVSIEKKIDRLLREQKKKKRQSNHL